MADFTIDVGFNKSDLMAQQSGGGAGLGGNNISSGADNNRKGGVFATALKASGIIGILMSLKNILDMVSFTLGIISSLISFLIGQVVLFLVPFFKDPSKAFTGLAIDIVNGVLTGIEFLSNIIRKGLNVIPGVNIGEIQLPRFQKDIIMEAYDGFRKAVESGDIEKIKEENRKYNEAWKDALMTREEFEKVKKISEATGISLQEASKSIEITSDSVQDVFKTGSQEIVSLGGEAFDKIGGALNYLKRRAEEVMGDGGRTRGFSSSLNNFNFSNVDYSNLGGFQSTPTIKRNADTNLFFNSQRQSSSTNMMENSILFPPR